MVDSYTAALIEFHCAVEGLKGKEWNPSKFDTDEPLAELRLRLIMEEADEVAEELVEGTRKGLAKELADLVYVIFGTAVEYDIPLDEVFQRVHANNMLKIRNSHFNTFGKLIKAKDHPKVDLSGIVGD